MSIEYRLDHIHLRSPDPELSAAFYVRMFGAKLLSRSEASGALRVILDLAGTRLFIERVPPGTAQPPEAPFLGVEHLGLIVPDLDAAASDLRENGAAFIVEPHSPRPGLKMAFVRGPENVRIEILERSA
jgi:catechol 2,3-dioxygenase-like lactoylglutathione lyase family enzyme